MDETDRVSLSDDWIEGEITNPRLVEPVMVARSVLKEYRHTDALALWIRFYEVACSWKEAHGVEPEFRLGIPRTFEQGWPWECAGRRILDPVDLLTIRLPGFGPYDSLERQHGRVAILAVICLEYAAHHDVEVAQKGAIHILDLGKAALVKRTVWQVVFSVLEYVKPTFKHGRELKRGRKKGALGPLAKWLDDRLEIHPDDLNDDLKRALQEDHKNGGGPPRENDPEGTVAVFKDKPISGSKLEKRASEARGRAREVKESRARKAFNNFIYPR